MYIDGTARSSIRVKVGGICGSILLDQLRIRADWVDTNSYTAEFKTYRTLGVFDAREFHKVKRCSRDTGVIGIQGRSSERMGS